VPRDLDDLLLGRAVLPGLERLRLAVIGPFDDEDRFRERLS